jgi:hypothetical protein
MTSRFQDAQCSVIGEKLQQFPDGQVGLRRIQMDAHDFMKIVRDYRNFVRLRNQRERGVTPDRDTVGMCWGPVLAVLNDLETGR